MAWPVGVETTTIVFGRGIDPAGNSQPARLEVAAVFTGTKSVVWEADGTPMLPLGVREASEAGMTGSVRLPVVDQDGWVDDGQNEYKNWSYRLTEKVGTVERVKFVQPLSGQATIDFDLIPDGSVGVPGSSPKPGVTSVAGLTGAITAAQLSAALEPKLTEPPTVVGVPIYARGTSFSAGASASDGAGFVDVVADRFNAPSVHNAGAGGSNSPSLAYQYADSPDKWIPGTSTGLVLIEAGIGEALSEVSGREKQFRRVFESCIRAAIRWHRAGAVRRGDHASITLGAGVTTESLSVSGVALDPGIKLNADGESFTITVGAGVTEIVLLGAPWRQSAESENGDYTITVNGVARKSTTKAMGDPHDDGVAVLLTLTSERVTGLTPGDVITVTQDGAGTVWFFGYLEMTNPTPPPIVLVQGVPVPEADATALAVYRSILDRVASSPEWEGGVVVADPSPTYDVADDTDEDGIHPNDTGHLAYADAVVTAALSL